MKALFRRAKLYENSKKLISFYYSCALESFISFVNFNAVWSCFSVLLATSYRCHNQRFCLLGFFKFLTFTTKKKFIDIEKVCIKKRKKKINKQNSILIICNVISLSKDLFFTIADSDIIWYEFLFQSPLY